MNRQTVVTEEIRTSFTWEEVREALGLPDVPLVHFSVEPRSQTPEVTITQSHRVDRRVEKSE